MSDAWDASMPTATLLRGLRKKVQMLRELGDAMALAIDDHLACLAGEDTDSPLATSLDAWNRKQI